MVRSSGCGRAEQEDVVGRDIGAGGVLAEEGQSRNRLPGIADAPVTGAQDFENGKLARSAPATVGRVAVEPDMLDPQAADQGKVRVSFMRSSNDSESLSILAVCSCVVSMP